MSAPNRARRAAALLAVACLFAAAAVSAAEPLSAQTVETGPPTLSVSHEVRNALARAEAWLAAHPGAEPDFSQAREPRDWAEAEALLRGDACGDFRLLAGLAAGLAAAGESLVFIEGEGVPWRTVLARKLILAQKVAADGTAWWENPAGEGDARAATAWGVRVLCLAYGLVPPEAENP